VLRSRYETRLLPIIMVTALNALEDKIQALEIGADDFLSKPINKTELLAKVRSILRVKALQDEVERQKRELQETNDRLINTQRFKEMMVQMVVHDLKNPLAGIMGNIQLLQLQGAAMNTKRLDEIAERIHESGRQMTRMILNILDVGRLEEQKMPLRIEPISLHVVAQEQLSELVSVAARDGIRLENRVAEDVPPVQADPGLISRVVANLLNNALKHTPEGGTVGIETRPDGEEIVLTVSDTGEGIPEELQPHIFEKFVAGDSDNSGRMLYDSGLGLTFCRLAVERHGGRIWIRSRPGEGTTVHIALPAQPCGAETGAGSTAAGAGSRAA
jgi:two-component system sensor histidine kinase/response regulator